MPDGVGLAVGGDDLRELVEEAVGLVRLGRGQRHLAERRALQRRGGDLRAADVDADDAIAHGVDSTILAEPG